MKDNMVGRIFDAIQAGFALSRNEAFELALQLLVWAKLSVENELPHELKLETVMRQKPGRASDVLNRIGKHSEGLSQAFPERKWSNVLDAGHFQSVCEIVLRLSSTGLLESLDPISVIASFQSLMTKLGMVLPREVGALLVGLADLRNNETVYLPWDYSGQLAAFASTKQVTAFLEIPIQSTIPVLVGLLSGTAWEVHFGDPIRSPSAVYDGGKLHKFDAAIAFPPFGLRYDIDVIQQDWFGRFPELTASGSVLGLRHLLSQAIRSVVVAMPNSILFSTGAELVMRTSLLNHGILKAVIGMPAGLLSGTTIPFAVLVLDPAGGHQRVRFVNADTSRFREPTSKARAKLINAEELKALVLGETDTEEAKTVPIHELLTNDAQLQVTRYVRPDSQIQIDTRIARAQTVSISDLCTTIRPMPTISADAEGVDVQEVGAADLPPFGYLTSPGRTVKVEPRAVIKNKHQFLHAHDIVLIVKGSVGKVGLVPPDVPLTVPRASVSGQSAYVLLMQPSPRLDP